MPNLHSSPRTGTRERGRAPKIKDILAKQVVMRPIGTLKPYPHNPRQHPESQIAALMRSISRGWTTPLLIDEGCTLLAGHGRLAAAGRLSIASVPTLMLTGLSAAEKRAIVIADNKLPEAAFWDFDVLRLHFKALIDLDVDVELTGFSTGEVDIILDGDQQLAGAAPDGEGEVLTVGITAVSVLGDIWQLGRHRILCGDSRSPASYQRLLGDERAQMVVSDVPYNVKISGHVCGRGKKQHREFAMASGEMTDQQFQGFLETAMRQAIAFSVDGSIHYWFIDWRHLPVLLKAGLPLYSDWKNLIVWNKSNAGQGAFYRSQHELIPVFKNGTAAHINNFGLGANGRYRTNVMTYPGGAGLDAKRREEMDIHPTVKPVALIADLVRDCSRRNGIILDAFGGSGTAILAAERTGRVGRLIEIDPLYVDLTIRRWEAVTGEVARHASTGRTFAETTSDRGAPPAVQVHEQTKSVARKRGR